jgi:hypothetical protein
VQGRGWSAGAQVGQKDLASPQLPVEPFDLVGGAVDSALSLATRSAWRIVLRALDGEAHKCRRALKWSSSRLRARRRAFAKNRTVCRPAQRVRGWPRMTGACARPLLPNSNISPNSHFISGRVRMTALVAAICTSVCLPRATSATGEQPVRVWPRRHPDQVVVQRPPKPGIGTGAVGSLQCLYDSGAAHRQRGANSRESSSHGTGARSCHHPGRSCGGSAWCRNRPAATLPAARPTLPGRSRPLGRGRVISRRWSPACARSKRAFKRALLRLCHAAVLSCGYRLRHDCARNSRCDTRRGQRSRCLRCR